MLNLRAVPVSPLSSDFRIFDGDTEVTILDLARFPSRGRFALDARAYLVQGRGIFRRSYSLEENGMTLCRAVPEGFRSMRIEGLDRALKLSGVGFLMRGFRLMHGDAPMGTIQRTRVLGRGAVAELPRQMTLPTQIFLLAVALLIWRRRARARSGGGG
jgi:hypothetical protein